MFQNLPDQIRYETKKRFWYDLNMVKSLQQLQDYYVNQGLAGERLREALENDQKYQRFLEERKSKLQAVNQIPEEDAKKYLFVTDKDYKTIGKIYELEKRSLSTADKGLVEFKRTQLELDWRSPILDKLDVLLGKYKEV